MKQFLAANILVYTLLVFVSFFYQGVSFESIREVSQLYILFNIMAFLAFVNFFNLKLLSSIIISISWIILLSFSYYIYRSKNKINTLYLWILFLVLWILLGWYSSYTNY